MNKQIVYIGLWVCIHLFLWRSIHAQDRPNILWISWEDVSPNFGCYGDEYAITPTIDQLAAEGVRYTQAFSHSGVCAPSRGGIITGMYPTAIGLHHMRVRGEPPPYVRLFPEYLRRAGYFCTNDAKTDYQTHFSAEIAWDEQGPGARWHNRKAGQPFFSVINFGSSHEGQIYRDNAFWRTELTALEEEGLRHDPQLAPLPPYFPDHPTVRKDVARYYDNMTVTDKLTKKLLDQLASEGLLENTIIFFWGDHGAGLTRSKRWIYDSGLQIPLIVKVPEKYQNWTFRTQADVFKPGTTSDELVAFVDFAPTVLSLAGIDIPDYMHGQAFLGPQKAEAPREYIYAGRDRMDEVYDLIRGVRSKQYKYIRNFLPHLPYAQTLRTMERMPTLQVMRQLHAEGKLNAIQSIFFQKRKPLEELYDVQSDPYEVHNLAEDPTYATVLEQMRKELRAWQLSVGDVGMIPEPILDSWRAPSGYWRTTRSPLVNISSQPFLDGRSVVELSSPTPGASVAWKFEGEPTWRLYEQPFILRPGQRMEFFAHRLGYYASEILSFQLGQALTNASPEAPHPFWMDELTPELIKDLFILNDLVFQGEKALPQLEAATSDARSVIAYWGVVGIYSLASKKVQQESVIPLMTQLLGHNEPIVRITAAHALAEWKGDEEALNVLKAALTHPLESVRLSSALALDKLGDQAKAVLPFPEIVIGTENQYANRVFLRMMNKWEK